MDERVPWPFNFSLVSTQSARLRASRARLRVTAHDSRKEDVAPVAGRRRAVGLRDTSAAAGGAEQAACMWSWLRLVAEAAVTRRMTRVAVTDTRHNNPATAFGWSRSSNGHRQSPYGNHGYKKQSPSSSLPSHGRCPQSPPSPSPRLRSIRR